MVKGEHIEFSLPEKLNLGSYYLDGNLEAGRGDRTAIYYQEKSYSFLDLWRLSNRLGNALKELGVEPENRVLLILEDSPMARRHEDRRGRHPRLHLPEAA